MVGLRVLGVVVGGPGLLSGGWSCGWGLVLAVSWWCRVSGGVVTWARRCFGALVMSWGAGRVGVHRRAVALADTVAGGACRTAVLAAGTVAAAGTAALAAGAAAGTAALVAGVAAAGTVALVAGVVAAGTVALVAGVVAAGTAALVAGVAAGARRTAARTVVLAVGAAALAGAAACLVA